MAGNPLSAGSLSSFMAGSLPKGDGPQLKTPYDAVALFAHACMVAVGFKLVGLGEDHKIEAHSEASDVQALPAEWNASSSYAFRYAHPQSSMEYLVKVNRLGPKAVVFGIGLGDDRTNSFDIAIKDYISDSSFSSLTNPDNRSTGDLSKALQDVFISEGRLCDLGTLFKLSIIQKLMPSLHKEGYEEAENAVGSSDRPRQPENRDPPYDPLRDDRLPQPARPHPFDDPLAHPPRRPVPPGDFPPPDFEDEYEINRPPRGFPPQGRNPLDIGHDDLYPQGLGPRDPLRGTFGPGGAGGLPRPGGNGGMHPTFDDPMFGGRRGEGGYDPRHPPGARYDPVGPGDGPPGAHGGPRFPGGGGAGRGGGPPNPFGGFGSGDFI
ncbi:MAG: hypothetical protein M1833_000910 [Piccolia ochrophora]|nr:MAG: hypothetical protein M1833_000910 [Piccolia ochrophora]